MVQPVQASDMAQWPCRTCPFCGTLFFCALIVVNHLCSAKKFEVVPRLLEYLCTPEVLYDFSLVLWSRDSAVGAATWIRAECRRLVVRFAIGARGFAFFLWCNSPTQVRAAAFFRFLHHTRTCHSV